MCRDGFVFMLLFMPVVVDNANFVFLTSLHGFVFVPLGPRYWSLRVITHTKSQSIKIQIGLYLISKAVGKLIHVEVFHLNTGSVMLVGILKYFQLNLVYIVHLRKAIVNGVSLVGQWRLACLCLLTGLILQVSLSCCFLATINRYITCNVQLSCCCPAY